MEYASYVIRDRAIPHVSDGFKPVQRRILQSLFDVDDGKFHKVANVVGHCMQYHPHGDASIYAALVNLANKEILIERQGNFGNILTGDPASAARYIECRVLPLGKEILFNPELTRYEDSYDGRRKEPLTFPCKVPLILILGGEGIAVGMSTQILPHNFIEVLEAVKSCLNKEPFTLVPDFFSGGLLDASQYDEGNGKVTVRAKLDTSDPKKIVIRELPHGVTTESMMSSLENAARRQKIKIGRITDYTTHTVEIEIQLPRGVPASEAVEGLYAFTDCERSISVNLLVIHENTPRNMRISEIIAFHADQLKNLLKQELELEKGKLLDKLHARTLERIFIEEKIYKKLEKEGRYEGMLEVVKTGFKPFKKELLRPVTAEDIETLLKIPIRRISLYDIERMKKEVTEIQARLKTIDRNLKRIKAYAVKYLDGLIKQYKKDFPRKTELSSITRVDQKDLARRDRELCYNPKTGYLGYDLKEEGLLFKVSVYDKILLLDKNGNYRLIPVPEKLFMPQKLLLVLLADKNELEKTVFSLLYKQKKTGYLYIKRCRLTQFIINKDYSVLPDPGDKLLKITTKENAAVSVAFKQQSLSGSALFPLDRYLVKGAKTRGTRVTAKEFSSAKFVTAAPPAQTEQKSKDTKKKS